MLLSIRAGAQRVLAKRSHVKSQPVAARKRRWLRLPVSGRAQSRDRASDHLLGLVVGLAVTPQRRRLGAGVKLFQAGRDLGVLALEQAVAGKIAFDQERPELVDVE